ncbi:hypothetical protein ACC687_41275, partial [Rhizobium ruizarguesonis]
MNALSLFPSLAARLARQERVRLAKARVPVALLAADVPGGGSLSDGLPSGQLSSNEASRRSCAN